MMRLFHGDRLFSVLLCGAVVGSFVGCCATGKAGLTALSGRSVEPLTIRKEQNSGEPLVMAEEEIFLGPVRRKMQLRGQQNGCGEFFWNSWVNDPPAKSAQQIRPVTAESFITRKFLRQRATVRAGCQGCGKAALEIHQPTESLGLPATVVEKSGN